VTTVLGDIFRDGREFVRRVKRAARGKSVNMDELFEYQICKEMGWSYEELMNTPHEVVIAFTRISEITNREMEKMRRAEDGNVYR
jgi:hypothetical protein